MNIRPALSILLSLMLLFGCTSELGGPEIARQVVLKYAGEGVGTVGPFNRRDKAELASLSAADQAKAVALLDHGAFGFLVFGAGNDTTAHASAGKLADLVNVDRIVFVKNDKIVGDFAAAK